MSRIIRLKWETEGLGDLMLALRALNTCLYVMAGESINRMHADSDLGVLWQQCQTTAQLGLTSNQIGKV